MSAGVNGRAGGLLLVGAVLLAAAAVGWQGAADARIYLLLAGGVSGVALLLLAYRWPEQALACTFLVILVASTKFRERSADAALSGEADSQVAFELALYTVVGAVVAAAALARWRLMSPAVSLEWLLVGYVLWAVMSIAWSSSAQLSVARAVQLAIVTALAGTAIRILGPARTLRSVGGALMVYVLVCAAAAVALPNYTETFSTAGIGRFRWFEMHPIACAILTALAALSIAAEAMYDGTWRRRKLGVPLWLCFALLVGVLVMTRSRGPIVAFMLGMGALVAQRRLQAWMLPGLASVAVLLVLSFLSTGESVRQLLREGADSENPLIEYVYRGQGEAQLAAVGGRTRLWEHIGPMVAGRPVTGYGYQAARAVLIRSTPWAGHAHNAVAQSLLDTGVVGTLLLWGALLGALRAAIRQRERGGAAERFPRAAAAGLLVFFILLSLTEASFSGPPSIQAAMVLVCISAAARWRREPARVRVNAVATA